MNTSIIQLLEQEKVAYRLLPHSSPATSIEGAAAQRGIHPNQMVKSILLRDMSNNYILACVPGDKPVDPKKVRAILNCRRVTCVSIKDVPEITGYQIGAIAPLLLKSPMPIIFDTALLNMQEITISSGNVMAGIAMDIQDLVKLCQPQLADIVK